MKTKEMMDRGAVLHIPLSQYAFPTSKDSLTIRIRVKKRDLTKCVLFYADRACPTTPIRFQAIEMGVCAKDEFFDYYEAVLHPCVSRICYYFKLTKGEEWTYYYADRFTRKLADFYVDAILVDGRSEYYQYPFILREEIPDVPQWLKTAVVYNIFPDSFASGKRTLSLKADEIQMEDGRRCKSRLGGTIKGIRENLDYIEDLGFTCIYLNPIFIGGEYHKYDVIDYYHVDPCMGTDEELNELVEDLHRRGMRIIIDGVFNHCSWEFFAFEDVVEKGKESRYCEWFYDLTFPVIRSFDPRQTPGYACFAYERKMPKLNTSDHGVQTYFSKVGAYWIHEFKVDGWRLDVGNEVDRDFWRRFRTAVKKANPEAVLIGEVWENAETWLRGDAFDSAMNYEFRRICRDFLAANELDAVNAAFQFDKMFLRYPTHIVSGQLNLLDSHDVPRFLSLCGGNTAKWMQACILLMLMPGAPSLFYGDEQGICGVSENEYRGPMVWETNTKLYVFVQSLIQIRKKYIDTSSGYCPVWELIEKGLFAFMRKNEKGCLWAALNTGSAKESDITKADRVLLCSGIHQHKLEPNGFIVCYRQEAE